MNPFKLERGKFQSLVNLGKWIWSKMPKGSGLTKPYKLSPELSDVVGKKEATRGECMKQLWAYIKEHKLQDPENKQYFKPDKKMAKIFGEDKLRGFGMAKYLKDHLS